MYKLVYLPVLCESDSPGGDYWQQWWTNVCFTRLVSTWVYLRIPRRRQLTGSGS